MEIEGTSLWGEVMRILKDGEKDVHNALDVHIHCMTTDKSYRPLKTLEHDEVKNYVEKYTTEAFVTVSMPLGDFTYDIYPDRDNLEISLFQIPQDETGNGNKRLPQRLGRFKAVMVDTGNPALSTKSGIAASKEMLNRRDFITVQFQIIDKMIYSLRTAMVGGNFRNCTVADVLKAVMLNESQEHLAEYNLQLAGVDLIDVDNKEVREHINIPQGTRLAHLPHYLQEHVGVYTTGMGYFLERDYWYIFPLYNTKRINQTENTMTIIVVPENKLPGIERTYAVRGGHPVVIATGSVDLKDTRRQQEQVSGNGLRYAAPDNFMGSYFQPHDGKGVVQQSDNVNEYAVDKTGDDKNFAPFSKNRITKNHCREMSRVAARRGSYITLTWNSSDTQLLEPGMLAKIMYLTNGEIKECHGSLLGIHTYNSLDGMGLTAGRYVRKSIMTFFVEGAVD